MSATTDSAVATVKHLAEQWLVNGVQVVQGILHNGAI